MSLGGIISEYQDDDNSPLSKASRVNIITQVLMRDDIEQYSRNQLLIAFRDNGLGIRTQDFLDLYRDVRGINISSAAIRSVPDDIVPREETFAPNKYSQQSDYLYILEYQFYDDDGETILSSSFGLSSNFRMSKNDVMDEFITQVSEYYPQREFEFTDTRVSRAFRKV